MKGRPVSINLFFHLYYESGLDILFTAIKNFDAYTIGIFVNISNDNVNKESFYFEIMKKYPQAIVIFSTNKGKDIGAKLAMIDLYIKMGFHSDYSILLHDKKSPHTLLGERWRKNLFRIVEKENIETILQLFEDDKRLGIVSANEFIVNEYDSPKDIFSCTSNSILKELIKKYSLSLNTFDFVGGTMFWIRTGVINSFFESHDALDIRSELENGNVLDHEFGTKTHAWERMFSWIATDQKFYIAGI